MIRAFTAILLAVTLSVATHGPAQAQAAGYWVQVEARPTLAQAQDRARSYAARFPDVGGFVLGTGWYSIALGPYAEADALSLLQRLLAQTAIPGDSFVATGAQYRQQFWPIGSAAPTAPQPLPDARTDALNGAQPDVNATIEAIALPPAEQIEIAPAVLPAPDSPTLPEESPAEARAAEAGLTQAERESLQSALAWAGHYSAAIDGAFGPGTRGAMERWQSANGLAATGVLTTPQREALLAAYAAILEGLDMQDLRDPRVGIEIRIPAGAVAFDAYDPPFARFTPTNEDFAAQVVLISQAGDRSRLLGLYEMLQTLEVVPPEGPRTRSDTTFEIEGTGSDVHTYATATLRDGAIKGFMLVWPIGDDERRGRVLAEMKASFSRIDGLLDPGLATRTEDQAIDLVSGLALRKPRLSRSGFYVDASGTVLTTTEAVEDCRYLTLDDDHEATVSHRDEALGLAVLRPQRSLAPLGVARFQTATPRLQSEVAVGGYPYGGILTMPSLTFGRLADLRGLNGEDRLKRLALVAQAGDAGGPVFDAGGAVLGMLLPSAPVNGQVLPPEVSFALETSAILSTLVTAGVSPQTTDVLAAMAPETLTRKATDMTVLVSCWE